MTISGARTRLRTLYEPFRPREWWHHKLAPMLGSGYMTAFHLHSSLLALRPTFAATLIGMAAAAAYVSVVNDLADLDEDGIAGKANRAAGHRPRAFVTLGIVLTVGAVVAIIAWRDDPLVLALYAAPWIAFSLYSLRPVRLKARGAAGVLADASGAHLFPNLLIAVAVFRAAGTPLDPVWLGAVAVWAVAWGIRGAVWHQLVDLEADARSRIQTFARVDESRARLAGRAAFVIEITTFLFLLWRAGSPLAFALLIPYFLLATARVHLSGARLIVVSPAPSYTIAMHEYYVVLYPLAFLVASSIRHPADVLMLVIHCCVFGGMLFGVLLVARGAVTELVRPRAPVVPRSRTGP